MSLISIASTASVTEAEDFVYMRGSSDCFQCCAAYVLARPWGHVCRRAAEICEEDPNAHGNKFWNPWYRWCRSNGLQLRAAFFPAGDFARPRGNFDWIAKVTTGQGWDHAVIFRGRRMLYDPDDHKRYTLDDVIGWYAFEDFAGVPANQSMQHYPWDSQEWVLGNRGWGTLDA